ncbi:MAG: oxidoreductase [Acidimicrobiales bacterium]|nr:oxidoreductase [Acidimicrobiales bacterium]
MFTAVVLDKSDDTVSCAVTDLDDAALPDRDVTVAVEWSTINYKDGLAITNSSPVVRSYPMVPGIDFAGTVIADRSGRWSAGERITVNGWEIGEVHWGGLAQRAAVEPDWVTALPDAISTRQAAAIGTAGYTAMLCVLALEDHDITADRGPVVVTGAAGGVGSVAVALLAARGYEVIASTGRPEESAYLTSLGAASIIDRAELAEPGRPLGKVAWAGAVDTVGSHTLANVVARTEPEGCVAACGLAQGMDFPSSVAPFILRGVTLRGVNSVLQPAARRDLAWGRLATDLDPNLLESMTQEVALGDAPAVAEQILAGQIRGRVVVDVNR